ncbi:MAG TPA: DNA translocase FtsK, partial [Blastocatellia bacterium]|nr:DNA translocase FtsK [Blastocatellia bacterium]
MSNRSSKQSSGRSLANEVVAVLLVAAAVLLGVSLLTYDPRDPSWNSVGPRQTPSNLIGIVGAYIGDFFLQLFGLAAFCIPVLFVLIAVRIFFSDRAEIPVRKVVGAALLLLAISGFISLFPKFGFELLANTRSNGGAAGYVIEDQLAGLLNLLGAAIVLTVASVLTLMLTMEVSLASLLNRVQSAREERAVSNKGKPAMFQKLRSWLVERIAERRRQAELKRAARIAEREQLERERQAQAEAELRQVAKGRRRAEESENRVEERRIEKELISRQEPVITRQVVASAPPQPEPVVASAQAQAEPSASYAEEEARELKTGVVASARAPSSIRSEMAAVIRERAARNEQAKAVKDQTPEVDVDPDVAEMTSTAWIDRTVTGERAGPAAKTARQASPRRKEVIETASGATYKLPTVALLEPPIGHHEQAEEELRERAVILAEKCKEFSVTGHIHRINPGPVVTTFEFKPDPGIKYSRVVGLADDLCLALKAESIRIDRIPGKSTVGIEAPNAHREKIFLRDTVESSRFQQSESKLTVALGKTINGEEYIADLARMPHLLIAGATGAGKSVTLNAIICSILYKASPDEVKFIMVDPKRVELGLYEGIPHLLTPIVTDPKRAANALKWAVNEMESRYRELAKLGVRNIEQFNREVREMTHPTLSDENPEAPKTLPYIVIAIDELADLMMVARGEVETSIARLAQMARAVGIHLVLATQRPSVDIITGVIKANIPSRIAFRVSSKVDSRT